MIDWKALTGESETGKEPPNSPKSGEIPHSLGSNSEKVGREETINNKSLYAISPLSPLSPLLFEGVGNKRENKLSVEGVASDNICDAKSYSIHPMAVCLVLACCQRIGATEQETIQAIIKLKHSSPSEQIRSWSQLCFDSGLDPIKIIHPFTRSNSKGIDCMSCLHIDMRKIHLPGERRVFHWACKKQHQILEGHCIGERVLIAPESCSDYLPVA